MLTEMTEPVYTTQFLISPERSSANASTFGNGQRLDSQFVFTESVFEYSLVFDLWPNRIRFMSHLCQWIGQPEPVEIPHLY